MGMFADLDVANAADDPFKVPPGAYTAHITGVEIKSNKDNTTKGLAVTYTVSDGEHAGKNVSEWKTLPEPVDPKNPTADEARALSFLKSRLTDFGIPAEKMNSVMPEDIIGLQVKITVTENKGYTNVRTVNLVQNVSAGAEGSSPFSM